MRPAKMLGDFGDYELLEEIGRGGQGVVYRAHQKSLNRTVALKVIGLGPWATDAHLKRFRREAEAAASLDHPFIVPIHEVGERDGCCYFSMNFIEGGQLDEVVKREPMPIRRAVELIARLARTVHYAHEHGILHRDIKPGNILLDAKGEPHLTDFGLARLVEAESTVTRTLEVMGTPSYMAPEQAVGNNAAVSSSTDVYGLGAVFYQLLTGHPPFAGGTTYETIKLLLDTEPRQPRLWNPKIARELSTICLKCLEKDPKRRYFSALALAEDLEHWLKHEPIRAKRSGFFTHARKWVRRKPAIAVLIASLVALAAAMGWNVWKSELLRATPEKSIAVLPFQNLSHDPDNAYFTVGMQDEILTGLGKIADLKIISRSSVMQYKSGLERDLRMIGNELGVANVLEGTVQRSGNRVRINAQLVDARNDAHLWAQTYDRDLEDVFAIQSEIAKAIADQLRAKFSPAEKNAIEQRPTTNLQAYDLYLRAQAIDVLVKDTAEWASVTQQRISFLYQAVECDPKFVLAYCELAKAHDILYLTRQVTPVENRTVDHRVLAEAALEKARRIQPDIGPVHLALADHFLRANNDVSQARVEIDLARRTMPNSAELETTAAAIARRQSRWDDAVRALERAVALEPRAVENLFFLADAYRLLRRYDRFDGVMARLLGVLPPDRAATYRVFRTFGPLESEGDLGPLRAVIATVTPDEDPSGAIRDLHNLILALWSHDPDSVSRISAQAAETTFVFNGVKYPKNWYEGLAARMRGDNKGAQAAFAAARLEVEKAVLADASDGRALSLLAMIDAGLGRREQAVQEGEHACELETFENSGPSAPIVRCNLAVVYAWNGQPDLAISTLEPLVNRPAGTNLPAQPTYGDFRWNPLWDPLRNDPRFQKLCQEKKP